MRAVLRTLVLTLLVAAVAAVCQAQEKCKVEGYVTEQSGKNQSGSPIAGVTIKIASSLGTNSGTTDKQGKYSVTVVCTEQSKHTVTPTKAGYTFAPASRPWDKYSGGPSFKGRKEGK